MKLNIAIAAIATAPCVSGFTIITPKSAPSHGIQIPRVSSQAPLFGILDEVNSDAFDLTGGSSSAQQENTPEVEQAYEAFLAQLVFSTNDPRIDIVENIQLASDPAWMEWLDRKINTSTDVEEKMALDDLKEMVEDIVKRVNLSQMEADREAKEKAEAEEARRVEAEKAAAAAAGMSDTDVLKKAGEVDRAGLDEKEEEVKEKVSFYDKELTTEIRMSYESLVKKVLPPYKPGDTPASIVFKLYSQFDAQFIKVLKERSDNGDTDAQAVLDALSVEQSKRMAAATETLKEVLSMGEPMRMEGKIVALSKEGKIDEPLLLLLEANVNQAKAAGATGPAQLMERLVKRAYEEKDKQSTSKEIKLIRQLLRVDDTEERTALLTDAFTPKQGLLVPGTAENAMKAAEGEQPEEEKPMPEVPPPDFINACKAVLLNFGNLSAEDEKGDLADRIKQIAAEAEAVATSIYGQGMTSREQQDRAWKEQTTSIFDLETLEIEAERRGETAPWANENGDDILPGFDADGKMRIGG